MALRLPFRATLGLKLALVLFSVVAGSLTIVYLMVVPRLENRLVDAKIGELEKADAALRTQLGRAWSQGVVARQDAVDRAEQNVNARVAVLQRLSPESLVVQADSQPALVGGTLADDPLAIEAAETRRAVSGQVERDGVSYAQHAVPFGPDQVILVSAPLDDALATVRLVRSSLVIAGLVALAAAAAAAYGAAYALTRRLRRLEGAAGRIAAGDFDVPIDAAGSDEVAELAREFDSMRLRLADLDRVRREFIANASHELRTPLFSLAGFLELLTDEDLDETTRREFLEETRTQVDRLTRLATDLLDLSRLDAGQLLVEASDIDLAAAARTVAEEFRAVAERSTHPLTVRADEETPAIGDNERVLQIGRALVENALRHTPPGTPIEVSASVEEGRAVLAVRDAGPGILEENQDRLFQRFYRGEGQRASGSGLGLAIAAELAAKMGGRLHVESAPGETVFTLRLPRADLDGPFPQENGDAEAAADAAALAAEAVNR